MKIKKRNRPLKFNGTKVFFCQGGFQDRLECILELLYSNACPSLDDIVECQNKTFGKAEDFTVKNARWDLKYMRTALHVPVEYFRSRHGYCLTDSLWHRELVDLANEELNAMRGLSLPIPSLELTQSSTARDMAETHFRAIVECLVAGMIEHHDVPFSGMDMRRFACSMTVTAWNLCLEKTSLQNVNKAIKKIMKDNVYANSIHNYMSYAAEMKWEDYADDRFKILCAEPIMQGDKFAIVVTVGKYV